MNPSTTAALVARACRGASSTSRSLLRRPQQQQQQPRPLSAAPSSLVGCPSRTFLDRRPAAAAFSTSRCAKLENPTEQQQQQQQQQQTVTDREGMMESEYEASDRVDDEPAEPAPKSYMHLYYTSSPPSPAPSSTFSLTGHVSRVGTMRKTVRVSRTVQVWDKFLRKTYRREAHDLVSDPHDLLLEGDVIKYGPFEDEMRWEREIQGRLGGKNRVRFVVRQVVTPFGRPVDQRTPRVVGSPEGRWQGGPGQVQKVVYRARGKAKPKVPVSSSSTKNGGKDDATPKETEAPAQAQAS